MGTFGCHNCSYIPNPNTPYLESPCATCKLANEYTQTHRAAMFDSCGNLEEMEEKESEYLASIDKSLEDMDHIDPLDARNKSLEAIKEACENAVIVAMSGLILQLVRLAKTYPVLFEIVIKKMQYPYMSYAEIGATMNPPCSKQNILYHMKQAVAMYPDLETVLPTDTRFSGGRYALKTIADLSRRTLGIKRIQGILYGDANPAFKAMGIKEINRIISAPFMLDDEIFEFNPYVADEEKNEPKTSS